MIISVTKPDSVKNGKTVQHRSKDFEGKILSIGCSRMADEVHVSFGCLFEGKLQTIYLTKEEFEDLKSSIDKNELYNRK